MREIASQAIEIYLQKTDTSPELEKDRLSYTVKIKSGLHTRLKARANHFGQAMNQLANAAIEKYLKQEQFLHI